MVIYFDSILKKKEIIIIQEVVDKDDLEDKIWLVEVINEIDKGDQITLLESNDIQEIGY